MSMFKEFRDFALRGNVVDMAIGIIIGAAFGTVVKSLVADIIMPPIGLALGNVDFSNLFLVLKQGVPGGPYPSLSSAQSAGAVSINYGLFVTNFVSFVIVAFSVFLIVRAMNRLKRKEEVAKTTRTCPFCLSAIPIKATKCAFCTSDVKPEA